ncbi:unnamed protein product [Musa hybrid cultivar]
MDYYFHQSSGNKKRRLDEKFEERQLEGQVKMNRSPQQPETPDIKDMELPLDGPYHHRSDGKYSDSNIVSRLGRELIISCLLHLSRSDYGAVASLNRMFRSLIHSGELYQLRRKMDIIEHWVYFSCSIHEWDAYDPYRERWIMVPKMPPTESFMCSDKESLAVGTELLVFGKEVNSHIVLRYSILTNSWSPGVVMNSPRCLFGSASLGVKAIIAGGINAQGDIVSTAEIYNSETHTWETLPSMNRARKMCSGVFMDGKFYVIGGMASNTKVLTCGEEYDLERRSWRVIPDMSSGLNGASGAPPLVAVVNNELYAAHYADKELRKYNKVNNTWVGLGRLPESCVSMNGWGLAFRACGERLIVIGGTRDSFGGMIELNSWIPNGEPPVWNMIASKHSGNFVYNSYGLFAAENFNRKTRLQDSRILSLGPMSTILKPAVAISLTSVSLHRSFATFPLANSNSSSNDAPARSGSPENADSPGVTLITAVDPGTSDGMAPDSPFDPKTWIRVPELPAKANIASLPAEETGQESAAESSITAMLLQWRATLLPFASSFSLASSVGAKLRGLKMPPG